MPEKLWLEKVQEKKGNLKVDGIVLNHEVIADFLSNMEKSPMFEKIRLSNTRKDKRKNLSLLKFRVDMTYKSPEKESKPPKKEGK